MQSDAKVPDPAPRGITVPAGAVVVLVLTGAIWGVGLFLLGRHTAPPVEVLDRAGAAHLASLNRIDQALVRGDQNEIVTQMASATLPDDPLGHTALELRRARLTELAVQQKAREAEAAAKRAAASPEAVLKRLQANLWKHGIDLRMPVIPSETPLIEDGKVVNNDVGTVPAHNQTPIVIDGENVVPDAMIVHPTITGRMYAVAANRGLLRSDDAGKTWRRGLAPLQEVKGSTLWFTSGDRPLLGVIGPTTWLFNDNEDAFFP